MLFTGLANNRPVNAVRWSRRSRSLSTPSGLRTVRSGRRRRSHNVLSFQDRRQGPQQDLTVEEKAPTTHVVAIQCHAFSIGERVSALDLPKATKPGPCPEIVRYIVPVAVEFRGDDRSRSNEAHVAAEYVKQLG